MKQVLFAIGIAIALIVFSIFSGKIVTDECDQLLYQLYQKDAATFEENWTSFSNMVAFMTPYDLIRTAESNASQYLSLVHSDASSDDREAAREILISSIQDIRRIHSISWELIF